MNTKTKESMNLKESKQSNCLVAMYIYEMPLEKSLAECLYSLSEQTKSIDLVIMTNGLSDEQISSIDAIAKKPFFTISKKAENGEVITEKIDAKKTLNFTMMKVEESLNFAQIFNKTFNLASDCGYEKITLAEAEDSFSLRWFDMAERYALENPEISIFLPLIRNSVGGAFSGLLNEATWAEGMSEEAGKVDTNLLLRYNCVNPLGAVYKIDAIKEFSEVDKNDATKYLPMKESMKLSHYYEFFLRMIYNDLKVMTVPRLGYELRITKKEMFTDSTCKLPQDITSYPAEKGGVSPEEGRFYFELGKKEYFFESDRHKVYQSQTMTATA